MSDLILTDAPKELVGLDGKPIQAYTPPTNGEVIACSSKKCQTCSGTGTFRKWHTDPSNPDVQYRLHRVCKCAVKGWEKKHGKDIATGKVFEPVKRDSFTGRPLSA